MDRVLFASDYPAATPQETIESIMGLGLTIEEQEQLFCRSAKALLDKEAKARAAREAEGTTP